MSDSIFGDLDLSTAAADPFKIPDGTYLAVVTAAEARLSEKGNRGLSITYTITSDDSDSAGKTVKEWKSIPTKQEASSDAEGGTKEGRQSASFLRQRLESLGIPPEELNSTKPDALVNRHVVITVKENEKGYSGVNKVELQQVTTDSSANPFAM
jgi:hypothetical protein